MVIEMAAIAPGRTLDTMSVLSVVALVRPVAHGTGELPQGAVGTIVHAWGDGDHYAVAFAEPFPCVINLARSDIQAT